MTQKGFIAGMFLLGGLGIALMLRGNPYAVAVGLIAAAGGGIWLFKNRRRKIDPTK